MRLYNSNWFFSGILLLTIFGWLVLLPISLGEKNFGTAPRESLSLKPDPNGAGIYFIGNSMFGTGLDIDLVNDLLPESDARLAYYDGHYSSMWYLSATLGFNSDTSPGLVVWGFRQTYAIMPAFRQNKKTIQADFERFASSEYFEVLEKAGSGPLVGGETDVSYTSSVEKQNEPFEILGTFLGKLINSRFLILREREVFVRQTRTKISLWITKLLPESTTSALFKSSGERRRTEDLFVAHVTNGEILTADALVVDEGERFVKGNRQHFLDSFIPKTTHAFAELGIRQIVVLFKPRNVFKNKIGADTEVFRQEAVRYFTEVGIPYIDFVEDPALTEEYFAKGDHYTQAGREYVTSQIVNAIKALPAVQEQ